jgi:hypothetical protein
MSESDLVLLPERFEFVSAVGVYRDEMLDPSWNTRCVPPSSLLIDYGGKRRKTLMDLATKKRGNT